MIVAAQGIESTLSGTRVRVEGAGSPLVLVHGVGLDLEMWDGLAAAMAPRRRVIRYDLLGHGASHDPPGPRRLADFIAQLDGLLAALEVERADVVGFSMGGLIARGFAAEQGARVRRLVLMNTVCGRSATERAAVLARLRQAEAEGPAATAEAALARWFSPGFLAADPPAVRRIRARLEANPREGFLKAYRVFADADREIGALPGRVTRPTLVMTGALDVGSTPEMARRLARQIPGARLAMLPGQRHLGLLEDQPAVLRPLSDFLAGDARPGPKA